MTFLGLHPGTVSRLGGVVGFAFGFQALFAAHAIPNKTEKYFDLAGSLGFITTALFSFYYPTVRTAYSAGRLSLATFHPRSHHPRQILITALYLLWAGRLGSFLFQRIKKSGKDSRFDEIKQSPAAFSGAWLGQAAWVSAVTLPAILVNLLPAAQPALGIRDLIGAGIWMSGIGFEIIADRQKSAWRQDKNDKKHDEQFISSGLWSLSRHPNYVGEAFLQAGPPLMALTVLPPTPGRYLVWVSPIFTYLLLRYGSGVPPLEKSGEKKWGKDPAYRKYVEDTSVMFPWPGGLGKGKAA
ncbi:hypothetical protein BD324DRAFT_602249 [Kockovaella imperatae]|uniref:Steroid 5-alpha reductase C-terminal domain-containing protein n=1 Tax=Kockovaella imperatae TaxID=4999 RepID=A0A1Y1UG41_9TREE|nr:hypothetical protein BD324DRAFT_602249 [Kockovaella imperatae]ORX36474.1 hypothetical protein BD324DRAFT_602249 [Kockovaella imperatae]